MRPEIEILVAAGGGGPRPAGLDSIDWPELFRLAAANKLLWPLIERLTGDWADVEPGARRLSEDVGRQALDARERVRRTLAFLETTFEEAGIDWRLVKTCRHIDYVPADIDVVVPAPQYDDAVARLAGDPRLAASRIGPAPGTDLMGEDKTSFAAAPGATPGEDFSKIDVHRRLAWAARELVAADLAFAKCVPGELAGVPVPLPPLEIDFLATAAALVFDRRSVPLLDLMWIEGPLYRGLDWQIVRGETERWGWLAEFASFLKVVEALAENFLGGRPPLPDFVEAAGRPAPKRASAADCPMPFPLGLAHDLRLLVQGWRHPFTAAYAFAWHRFRSVRERLTKGRRTGFGSWYRSER